MKLSCTMLGMMQDVYAHDEFASDDASLEVDVHDVVTHDVT